MTLRHPEDLPAVLGMPLSAEQLAAATAPLDPQLIVAGAGTGKTTVMAARVVWLVGTAAVAPGRVLGLTFTNKAATELRQRIRSALSRLPSDPDSDPVEPTVSTYHAFAGRIITEFGGLLGLEPDCRVLSDGLRSRLAYQVACDPVITEGLSGSLLTLTDRILAMDDALADLDISPGELRQHDSELLERLARASGPGALARRMADAAGARIRTSHLVDQFRSAKVSAEHLDFADQVRFAAEIAATLPSVVERITERFGVVLLDEYQDTSRAQRRMLQNLFGAGQAVTAVGDPCQAIYGWRGASVTNIDEFPRHFRTRSGSEAACYGLTVNRRSGAEVLAAANGIATELRAVHRQVSPLVAPAEAVAARVRCALLPSQDAEVAWLGRQVSGLGERRDWSDIAVLCRTNDQVATVSSHLRDLGIPVRVASQQNLLAAPEVVWVTSLLRVLADPYANPELLHHLTGPRWRIGPRDLALLGRRARELAGDPTEGATDPEISLRDAVQDPGGAGYSTEARERFAAFAAELTQLGAVSDRPAATLVAETLDLLGPLVAEPGEPLPESLIALQDLAQDFRSLGGGRAPAEFAAYLGDCLRFGSAPQSRSVAAGAGVHLMTMHAAKGLEFPVVLVPFLSEGVFPSARGSARWPTSAAAIPPVSHDEPDVGRELGFPGQRFTTADHDAYVSACRDEDTRDEDRLAYVAVTRAREEVIASGHWWGPTQSKPRGPSPYLLAVREVCLAGAGTVDEWQPEAGDNPAVATVGGVSIDWPAPATEPAAVAFAEAVAAAGAGAAPADVMPRELRDRVAQWDELIDGFVTLRSQERAADRAVAESEVLSVSSLIARARNPQQHADDLARPMPRRPSAQADRGTRFHAWIESRLGQQALFELEELAPEPVTPEREFADLFARTRFADVEPAAVEHPFTMALAGTVITGRIDAVFRCCDDPRFDWEVVDWKTGSATKADPLQLSVYREAWARQVGCDPSRIRGTFVFLADGSQAVHDDLPDPVQALGLAEAGVPRA